MNNENQNRLDQLFDSARTESPKTSFNDVQKTFVAATTIGLFAVIVNWFLGASKVAKIGVMISTITAATLGVTMIVSSPKLAENNTPKPSDTNHKTVLVVNDEPEVQEESVIEFEEIQQDSPAQVTKKPLQHILQTGLDFRPAEHIDVTTNRINSIVSLPVTVDEKNKAVIFTITEKTQPEDFAKIKTEAEKAGVKFNHKTKYRNSIIKRTTIKIVIEYSSRMGEQRIEISGADTFSHTFGWVVDVNGKAIEVYSEDDTEVGALEDLEEWANDLVEGLELEEFESNELEKIEMDLEKMEEGLELKIENLVESILLNLDEDANSTEEIIENWKIEVENWSKDFEIEINTKDLENLNSKELEATIKKLEADLEKLMENLEEDLEQK